MARRTKTEILVSIDTKGAVKGVKAVDKQVVKFGKDTKKAGGKVKKFGGTMQVALGAVAAGAAIGLARALGRLVRGGINLLKDSVRAAGIQDLVQQKLAQALTNIGEEADVALPKLKALAAEIQTFTNFGDESIITAQAMLLTFREVGGSEGVQLLTQSVVDMAAGLARTTGETVDLNTVAITLGKALSAGVGVMSRYGISLNDAQKAAFNAAKGMDKVRLVQEIIADNFGGLAAATADPFKQLDNSIGDLKETFGEALLPVLRDLATAIKNIAEGPETKEFVRLFGETLADALSTMIQLAKDFGPAIKASMKDGAEASIVFLQISSAVLGQIATNIAFIDKNFFGLLGRLGDKQGPEAVGNFGRAFEAASVAAERFAEVLDRAINPPPIDPLDLLITSREIKTFEEESKPPPQPPKPDPDDDEFEAQALRILSLGNAWRKTATETKLAADALKRHSEQLAELPLDAAEAKLRNIDGSISDVGGSVNQLASELFLFAEGIAVIPLDAMDEKLRNIDGSLMGVGVTAEEVALRLTTIGDELGETFGDIMPEVFVTFISSLTEAIVSGANVLDAFRSIALSILADILRAMAQQLIVLATGAALTGNFVKAARLAVFAGLLMGAAAGLERLAQTRDDRTDFISTRASGGSRTTVSGSNASELVSGGGIDKRFNNPGLKDSPVQVNVTGNIEGFVEGEQIRLVLNVTESSLNAVRPS